MMETLLLPLQFPFMQNALLIVMLVAPAAAMLSCFMVLKGWSLLGDATAHAVLPGVVLAYVASIPLVIGAFLAGLLCALSTGFIQDHSRVKQDTVLGVVFSGMFALGIVIYTQIETDVHLDHILFGNMLGVGPQDLWTAGGIALTVTVLLAVKWRDLLAHAFDPVQARMVGMNTNILHYGLLAILSATVVAMLSSVGIILSIGLLIAPGATAYLLTRRFAAMLWVSIGIAVSAGIVGTYASFWLDSAPAATIVLVLTIQFLIALIRVNLRHARTAQQTNTPAH